MKRRLWPSCWLWAAFPQTKEKHLTENHYCDRMAELGFDRYTLCRDKINRSWTLEFACEGPGATSVDYIIERLEWCPWCGERLGES